VVQRHAAELGYGTFAYLDRIAVAPAARRHGVGRASTPASSTS
jgi:predicted GNAT superfamily acetyltransferase